MESNKLYDLERLTNFRHDLHKHAELSYKEVRTSGKIIEYLTSLGINESQIRKVAQTGLIVDITGTAPASGKPFCVALRADMDGLPIKEDNPEIDYQSVTEAAHMCGHDMHMTGLVGGTSKILEKLNEIPSDKKLRLLFQPAEEAIGGALPMIKEGAMEGVDEVYGFHNWPWGQPGKLFVKKGPMMACITDIDIVIHGKGGHSSIPEQLKDPLQPAVDILAELRNLIKEYKDKGEKFTICLPFIKTGNAPNAISDTAQLKGAFRSFEKKFTDEFRARLRSLVEETCKSYGCNPDIKIEEMYPATVNTDKETDNVVRVATKVFGEGNVLEDERLPVFGAEDFSYFSQERPGCFFFLSSARNEGDVLHTNKFNAHDGVIPLASEMWLRLIEDRFELKF